VKWWSMLSTPFEMRWDRSSPPARSLNTSARTKWFFWWKDSKHTCVVERWQRKPLTCHLSPKPHVQHKKLTSCGASNESTNKGVKSIAGQNVKKSGWIWANYEHRFVGELPVVYPAISKIIYFPSLHSKEDYFKSENNFLILTIHVTSNSFYKVK